jgi:hypothetical protein
MELPETAIEVDGRVIDVAPLLPLKMGAWKQLRKLGVDPVAIGQKINRGNGEVSGEVLETLVYFVLKRFDPTLTDQILDDHLELQPVMRLGSVIMRWEGTKTTEGPTSTASSPPPSDGAGDQPTSIN